MMKAILFDFGGIFIDSPFLTVDDVAAEMQLDKALLRQIIFGNYHEDGDHPWHRLERGELSLEQTREDILALAKQHDLHVDIYEVFAKFASVDRQLNHTLIQRLLDWKDDGIHLAVVTNNIKEFDHWREVFPFAVEDVFDVIADSCRLGMRKPSASIFEYALSALDIAPQDAVFVDDYPANVDAAKLLGLNAYRMASPDVDETAAFIDWVEALR